MSRTGLFPSAMGRGWLLGHGQQQVAACGFVGQQGHAESPLLS